MAIFKGKKFIMAWPRFEPGTRLATAGDHLSYYATGHAMLDTALISMYIKPRANRRNIVGQQLPTLLDVTCCVCLHFLLHVVAQSLKPVKLFSQQLPTFLLFRDRRSVAQQCWIRLHGSSNIVGATHAHYTWIAKTYGLYSSHDALQVPNLLGVVASVCTPLPTRTQKLPTLLAQQCWELLRPFARSLTSSLTLKRS